MIWSDLLPNPITDNRQNSKFFSFRSSQNMVLGKVVQGLVWFPNPLADGDPVYSRAGCWGQRIRWCSGRQIRFFLVIFSESSMCSVYSWLSGNQSNPNIIGQHISEMHSISPFNEIVFVFFSYYLPSCNPTFIFFYILRILWPNSSDPWNFHRLIFKISFPLFLECFTLLNCNAQLFIKKFVYWKTISEWRRCSYGSQLTWFEN